MSGICVEANGGDDEFPECLLDCPGLEDLWGDENPDSLCSWTIEISGTSCYEDCDEDLLLGIPFLADACNECLENEDLDCADIFEDDCDPDLMCAQVETCVDGLLYPTSCGSDNCDAPIGECNDGVLYGYVQYIWGI
jgi:hypothetical protein